MAENNFDDLDFLTEDDDNITEDSRNDDQMYEHYRFVADKGQNLLRIDKFCRYALRVFQGTGFRRLPMQTLFW